MKLSMTGLVCAAVIGAFALAAQAQTSSYGGTTQTQPQADTQKMTGDKAKTDADYKAAQEACNLKSGSEKDTCLKDAKAAYDRALGKKDTSMSGSQGAMGSTGGTPSSMDSSKGSSSGTSSPTSTDAGKKQ